MISLTGILTACGLRKQPETQHEADLREVRELIKLNRKTPHLPDSKRYLPTKESVGWNGSWTLTAGVWVGDALYYEALGIPLGTAPKGDDVTDRHPGIPASALSSCARCKRSWKWVEGHSTFYSESSGMFPLCEKCWKELTPQERLPYYRALWSQYPREDSAEWLLVERAVLAGK